MCLTDGQILAGQDGDAVPFSSIRFEEFDGNSTNDRGIARSRPAERKEKLYRSRRFPLWKGFFGRCNWEACVVFKNVRWTWILKTEFINGSRSDGWEFIGIPLSLLDVNTSLVYYNRTVREFYSSVKIDVDSSVKDWWIARSRDSTVCSTVLFYRQLLLCLILMKFLIIFFENLNSRSFAIFN